MWNVSAYHNWYTSKNIRRPQKHKTEIISNKVHTQSASTNNINDSSGRPIRHETSQSTSPHERHSLTELRVSCAIKEGWGETKLQATCSYPFSPEPVTKSRTEWVITKGRNPEHGNSRTSIPTVLHECASFAQNSLNKRTRTSDYLFYKLNMELDLAMNTWETNTGVHFNVTSHLNRASWIIFTINPLRLTTLVEALRYKPEGRGFDSRWPWGRLSL